MLPHLVGTFEMQRKTPGCLMYFSNFDSGISGFLWILVFPILPGMALHSLYLAKAKNFLRFFTHFGRSSGCTCPTCLHVEHVGILLGFRRS